MDLSQRYFKGNRLKFGYIKIKSKQVKVKFIVDF